MSQIYIGQILQGGWNFAPRNTAMSNGQLIAIAQNQALFALLGTTYGGNGTTTFALVPESHAPRATPPHFYGAHEGERCCFVSLIGSRKS